MEFGPTLPTYWFADSNHGNAEGKCQQPWYLTVIAYDDDDDDDDGDDDDDDGEDDDADNDDDGDDGWNDDCDISC